MPAHLVPSTVLEYQLLAQLGERLAVARRQQRRSGVEAAATLGISRNTLRAAERGDPSVTMGTYLRILAFLGLAGDLALLASGLSGRALTEAAVDPIARRHRVLEAAVERGQRDARTLVTVPKDIVREATVTFPEEAFGEAEPW